MTNLLHGADAAFSVKHLVVMSMFLWLIIAPNCALASSKRKKSSHPRTLKYYVQAQDSQGVDVLPPVNSTVTGTFGQVSSFAYYATQEADVNSTQVGTVRGLEVYDSMNPAYPTILVLNTVTYNDGVYNGTVSLHGQANIVDTSYEITVLGGTGCFRGVRGYAAITNLRTPGSDHIFKHVLHFLPSTA